MRLLSPCCSSLNYTLSTDVALTQLNPLRNLFVLSLHSVGQLDIGLDESEILLPQYLLLRTALN